MLLVKNASFHGPDNENDSSWKHKLWNLVTILRQIARARASHNDASKIDWHENENGKKMPREKMRINPPLPPRLGRATVNNVFGNVYVLLNCKVGERRFLSLATAHRNRNIIKKTLALSTHIDQNTEQKCSTPFRCRHFSQFFSRFLHKLHFMTESITLSLIRYCSNFVCIF